MLHGSKNKQEAHINSKEFWNAHSHLFASRQFFFITVILPVEKINMKSQLKRRERRQAVLSVKLGCSVAIIKGTETVQWSCVGGKKLINETKWWLQPSEEGVWCCDFKSGCSLSDLAQLLQDKTYLQFAFRYTTTIVSKAEALIWILFSCLSHRTFFDLARWSQTA